MRRDSCRSEVCGCGMLLWLGRLGLRAPTRRSKAAKQLRRCCNSNAWLAEKENSILQKAGAICLQQNFLHFHRTLREARSTSTGKLHRLPRGRSIGRAIHGDIVGLHGEANQDFVPVKNFTHTEWKYGNYWVWKVWKW